MKRMISSALLLSVFALPVAGIVGCGGEETKVTSTEKVSTPGGTATKTDTSSVKTTGDNPPVVKPEVK